MINNDAHNQWEDEYNNAKRLFDKFDKILGIVYDQLSKKKSEQERFLKRSDEWKDKPLEEVFIDDLVFDEKGKPIKNLFASLKGVYDTIKQEDIDKLPEEQRRIAQKRFKELHELVDRGQRMIDAGKTEEFTDKILGITYDMCKDGLREATKIDLSGLEEPNLFPTAFVGVDDNRVDRNRVISKLDWFNSSNGITKTLGNETFSCFTEYVSSKTTPEAFNAIENVNMVQGRSSYYEEPCYRKYAILKSMGYDITSYKNWKEASKDLSAAGFFVNDRGKHMRDVFYDIIANPQLLDPYYEGQAVFDAAIQIVLENSKITGIDSDNHSMILLRTEDRDIVPNLIGDDINGKKTVKGDIYFPGVCESHGHIVASNINPLFFPEPKTLTVVRVPFNRIHSLWFMERGQIDSKGTYIRLPGGGRDSGDFQFWAYHQNEIDACTHGLPIICVDDLSGITDSRDTARKTLENWENINGSN